MKIQMTKTLLGSNDGRTVQTYEIGQFYDVSNDLAANFVGQCAASYVLPAISAAKLSEDPVIETKTDAPEPSAGPTENKVAAPAETKPAKRRGAGK